MDEQFINKVAKERLKPTCPFCKNAPGLCGSCISEAANIITLMSPYLSHLVSIEAGARMSQIACQKFYASSKGRDLDNEFAEDVHRDVAKACAAAWNLQTKE